LDILFSLNTRLQFAALLLVLVLAINFFKNPRLNLLSTRCFTAIFFITIGNLVFDILTVYTVNHLETVSPILNRILHQVFIESVILVIFFNSLYLLIVSNNQKRLKGKPLYLVLTPLTIATLFVLFGKLDYRQTLYGNYSFGPMALSVYGCGFIYMILNFIISFTRSATFNKRQRSAIRITLLLWISALSLQAIFPYLLLSGITSAILLLAIYLPFENQTEYFDYSTGCFYRSAFLRILSEELERKNSTFIINIVIENFVKMNKLFGSASEYDIIRSLQMVMASLGYSTAYHSSRNVLSFFIRDKSRNSNDIEKQIRDISYALNNSDYKNVDVSCHVDVIDLNQLKFRRGTVLRIIDFISEKESNKSVRYVDEKTIMEIERRNRIVKDLNYALLSNGFELYYQPIYWANTGKFLSAEALLRFKSISDLGYISPEEFIPIAEQEGLIQEIGDRVFTMAAEFISENINKMKVLKYIDINLSVAQAVSSNIDQSLHSIFSKYKIPSSFINLEVTESAIADCPDNFKANIQKLRNLGYMFSMDDFGTGYSNLSQVLSTSYEHVKLDKSLIWPVFSDKNKDKTSRAKARKLLESIISMARTLSSDIIAEGIETSDMADYLISQGVVHLQGYYYSKPIPAEDFIKLLDEQENS